MIRPLALLAAAVLAASPAVAAPKCPTDGSATALLCQAVGASDAEKFADAAALFERAAAASPAADTRTARMLAAAGNMWIAAGQPGKAAAVLDRALADPRMAADQRGLALLDRARAAEAQNDLPGARRFAEQALTSAGNDPFAWYFSAALAVREGNIKAAKSAIDRALALAPNTAEILFEAGFIANEIGNTDAARGYWQKAITADAGGKVGTAAQRALDALDKTPPATAAPTPPVTR